MIKSPEDIFNMDIADKKKLAKWVKTIIADVYIYNIQTIRRTSSAGLKECWVIDFHPDKELPSVACNRTPFTGFGVTSVNLFESELLLPSSQATTLMVNFCFSARKYSQSPLLLNC